MQAVAGSQTAPFLSQNLARAMANKRRAHTLAELNVRQVMSPNQYAEEFGVTVTAASKAFRKLEELGCAEIVEEKSGNQRRGAIEHFYRATQRAMFGTEAWEALLPSIRNNFSGVIFETYMERVIQAMSAGTLDRNPKRHFSWTPLYLDAEGWAVMIGWLDDLFERVTELQVEATLRMAKSGQKPIPATVALAGFESPTESELRAAGNTSSAHGLTTRP